MSENRAYDPRIHLLRENFLRRGWIASQLGLARVAHSYAPQVGYTRLAVSSPAMTAWMDTRTISLTSFMQLPGRSHRYNRQACRNTRHCFPLFFTINSATHACCPRWARKVLTAKWLRSPMRQPLACARVGDESQYPPRPQ